MTLLPDTDDEPGDAAEPYRCQPADFPHVTYRTDSDRWPHVVAVAGGLQYTAVEAKWLVTQFVIAIGQKLDRNTVHVSLAPTAGACSILYAKRHADQQPVEMAMLRTNYGRAAEFRCAWDLLNFADSVILFEPLDAIARHIAWLAPVIETRWGRGLHVKRVTEKRKRAENISP